MNGITRYIKKKSFKTSTDILIMCGCKYINDTYNNEYEQIQKQTGMCFYLEYTSKGNAI